MRGITRKAICLFAVLTAASPGRANGVREPTFAQLMDSSQLVLIGTVTATGGRPNGFGFSSSATLSVLSTLKGEAAGSVTVVTYSPIAELDPRCCEIGATYLMFLRDSSDGQLASVRGVYGMIRIGGPVAPPIITCATENPHNCRTEPTD